LKAMDAGASIAKIESIQVKDDIARMKYVPNSEFPDRYEGMLRAIENQFSALEG
jgi:vacuolar-type H+-ATPase catalytic subunit A/Vma1